MKGFFVSKGEGVAKGHRALASGLVGPALDLREPPPRPRPPPQDVENEAEKRRRRDAIGRPDERRVSAHGEKVVHGNGELPGVGGGVYCGVFAAPAFGLRHR